jgi:hypothetical protein
MTDRLWNDQSFEDNDELSFELQEMLSMLSRIEGVSDLADAASNDFGDDYYLDL